MYDDSIVWEEYHHITTSSRWINRLMNAIHSGAEFCCLFVCLFVCLVMEFVSYRIVSYRILLEFLFLLLLYCTVLQLPMVHQLYLQLINDR
jgi:hypothetical protein